MAVPALLSTALLGVSVVKGKFVRATFCSPFSIYGWVNVAATAAYGRTVFAPSRVRPFTASPKRRGGRDPSVFVSPMALVKGIVWLASTTSTAGVPPPTPRLPLMRGAFTD